MADQTSICPVCGVDNPPGRNFCKSCGCELDSGPEPEAIEQDPHPDHGEVQTKGSRSVSLVAVIAIVALALAAAAGAFVIGSQDGGSSEGAGDDVPQPQPNGLALPRVVCMERAVGKGAEWELVLKSEPDQCTFLYEGANVEQWFDFQILNSEDLRWLSWTADSAIAEGTYWGMGPEEATFRLSRPRTVCGERVFTWVRTIRTRYESSPGAAITGCRN